MINKEKLLEFVAPYYENKDIMHNLSHIERVLKSIKKLIKSIDYKGNMDILIYGAYFHGFIYNDEKSIIIWLQSQNITQKIIDKVINSACESQKDEEAITIEGKILHDAHMIEGGKTYLIVKSIITDRLEVKN